MKFYVISYGNEQDNRQGIFSCEFNQKDKTIVAINFYPTKEKPGSLVLLDELIIFSSINTETKKSYLTLLTSDENNNLYEKEKILQENFYSTLSITEDKKYLLGASFYEGIDSVFHINNLKNPESTFKHEFRKRTDLLIQQNCHSHFIGMTKDNKYIYSTDLGTDEILVYSFSEGQITLDKNLSLDRKLGDGPRLMPFGQTGEYAYLLNELSNRIDVFFYNNGVFSLIQEISTLKEDFHGTSSSAAIKISENGKYLAASNRGEDSIVLFDIDRGKGYLTLNRRIYCGKKPRDIEFLEDKYILVCSQDENRIELFDIDGVIENPINYLPIPTPVFIKTF